MHFFKFFHFNSHALEVFLKYRCVLLKMLQVQFVDILLSYITQNVTSHINEVLNYLRDNVGRRSLCR